MEDWDEGDEMNVTSMRMMKVANLMEGLVTDPEETLEMLMEEMGCMSTEDCYDEHMSSELLAMIADASERDALSCGWIDMEQMGDSMSTTDFCMPTALCGQEMSQEAMGME